ncbi:MAG: alpha/beta hydrolase [Pseudomonadota bacterium]
MPAFGNYLKRAAIWLAIAAVSGAIIFAFGPREPFTGVVDFDANIIGDDVEVYIHEGEARFSDVRDGLHKEIIWANGEAGERRKFAVVYVHGFSASKEEVRPVPDLVAEGLSANLYFARLKGHGRSADAMAEASAEDWLNDMAESLAVGNRIADETVVIATSTGATLATYLAATRPELFENVRALALISPNFKLIAPGSSFLTLPYARWFMPILVGEHRIHTRPTPAQEHAWTTPYATVSLMPMARLTQALEDISPGDIKVPVLLIYSEEDTVIEPATVKDYAEQWGATARLFRVEGAGDDHVIAGAMRSPQTTDEIAQEIVTFVNALESGS